MILCGIRIMWLSRLIKFPRSRIDNILQNNRGKKEKGKIMRQYINIMKIKSKATIRSDKAKQFTK